ncbi:MAG: UbiA family prenyltransferase [Peptococcaceae bacterium]|nr:UbiA family prenyltransferase [Peptococcaceae bacterium]
MAYKKIKIFLEMIKVEHTLFALPFAYTGALLVNNRIPSGEKLFWITLAMVGARTAAMGLNRIIDLKIDSINPRTAGRALPAKLLSVSEVLLYVIIALAVLFVSAYQLSPLAFKLFPVAVVLLVFYSYSKRFTWLCHLVLGVTLGLAPLGAWIAIADNIALTPLLLAFGVMFWVAGFDIVYSCNDYDFDCAEKIFSIPAKFGINNSLKLSAIFHFMALSIFILVGISNNMGIYYNSGVFVAGLLLLIQYFIVKPGDLSKTDMAFFKLNAGLSIVFFVFTLLDVVL